LGVKQGRIAHQTVVNTITFVVGGCSAIRLTTPPASSTAGAEEVVAE
jgi:hypothetical protein